jgi:YggT family protein
MDSVLGFLATAYVVLGRALFWIAAVAAVIALVDWLARTRRLNPFGPIPQFFRKYVDPVMRPIEARIVRSGGQPSSAPWWTLVFIVVGGLLLLSALQFVHGLLRQATYASDSAAGMGRLLLSWAFGLLRLALIIRVVSTWFGISPYSKWIRWTYTLTEWMLAPLRRMIPNAGAIDLTPLVAYLLLSLLQGAVTR